MMPSKTTLIILLLGLLFSHNARSQRLHLLAMGRTESETTAIDSLYYQKAFGDFASLQNEVALIQSRLTKTGYLESELTGLEQQNDTTYTARFHVGKRYKNIRLHFDSAMDKSLLKLVPATIGDRYFDIAIEDLEATLELLNSEASNQGDPFSTLQLSNIKKDAASRLHADLVISEQGPQRTIDSILVKGYEKFPKAYLRHYLKIRRQQPFNLKTVKNKMSELDNLGFAGQIKDPEVLFTKDSTLLYIYIEKRKSNAFDGFLGFGTHEETGKIEFNGYLNLNLTNNLNYGESLQLLYKSDESEQKTFDVKARLPYLFGSPIGTQLGLNIFRRDSTFVTVAQTAQLEYQIDPRQLVSAGINAVTSTNLLDNATAFVEDYTSTFYTADYVYTKRQPHDPLFPENFRCALTAGFGSRSYLDVKDPQSKFQLNTFKIFNLNDKNSIYLDLAAATLLSDRYLENELFRFGGINSLRGFEENSLQADMFSVIATEYRYRVSHGLYIHSVLDGAYLENKITHSKEKLFGFGFGLGLMTKSGLFRLNYACGKAENRAFRLSDSKIHISLTAGF